MALKVLIVDDETATREVIQKLADWDAYNMEAVTEASNGTEALDYIKGHPVDIVITDMNMPGMNGMQLLDILMVDYKDIKTIVVSGYDDFKYLQNAIRAQSIDYLLKPINPLELNKALEKTAIEWKKSVGRKTLHFSKENKELIPVLKEFKLKLFTILRDRNPIQLQKFFKDIEESVGSLMKNKKDITLKFHQEMILYLEEQLYNHDLTLEELEISEDDLIYDPEKTEQQLVLSFYSIFDALMTYLISYKQENPYLQVQDVKTYIDRIFNDKDISLRQIATEFHISKEYLSKAFKEKFDVNITEYILSQRMEKAKQLIVEDNMKIKHAAEYVGYDDLAYFYRVWKKYFNFPPGQLKKSNKSN